jgi:hypothetical protein
MSFLPTCDIILDYPPVRPADRAFYTEHAADLLWVEPTVDAMYAPVVHRFRTCAIQVTPEVRAYMDAMTAPVIEKFEVE